MPGGVFQPLIQLAFGGATGESAILADPGGRAGIMIHQSDATPEFRLVDLQGQTIATVNAPLAFHYRLAPDGASLVGIAAGGAHMQADADWFTYHFYDNSGNLTAGVRTRSPSTPPTPPMAPLSLSTAASALRPIGSPMANPSGR